MSDDISIRLAGAADAALIADMSRRTFHDSFAAQNTRENMDLYLGEQFTREKLIAEVGIPGNYFLLALLNNQPAGYAFVRESRNPPGLENMPLYDGSSAIEIARIYSEQWAIGKGVGKALMQGCLDIARQKDKRLIWLGVWEHNLRAIAFYTRWGFEKFSEHIFVVGTDPQTDWLLCKTLTPPQS